MADQTFHDLLFYWLYLFYFFRDLILILKSSHFSFIVSPSIYYDILLVLATGMLPSLRFVLLGFLTNYIVVIKKAAYLLRGEVEVDLPCSNVDDGLGGV
jgi:hypothetical protein